jgi:hypothetical protein
MDVALGNLVEGFPNFPSSATHAAAADGGSTTFVDQSSRRNGHKNSSSRDDILSARHTANTWLLSILQIPTVRNSTIMRQFLCYDANVVPVQFEGLAWIHFNTTNKEPNADAAAGGGGGGGVMTTTGGGGVGATQETIVRVSSAVGGGNNNGSGRSSSVPHTPPQAGLSYAAVTARGTSSLPPRPSSRTNLDEMEMDDMFTLDDEEEEDHVNPNKEYNGEEEDDEDAHSIASYENEDDDDEEDDDDDDVNIVEDDDADYLQGRYEPTDDDVSQSEIMEFQQDYATVEMVEDVGSLAQSLGASHLGRSLNLQREYMAAAQARVQAQQQQQQPLPPLAHQLPGNIIGGGGIGNNMLGGGIHIMDQGQNVATVQVSSSTLSSVGEGGIGGAMALAAESGDALSAIPQAATQAHVQGLGDSFHRTAPVSAPKLDSFNMIKVIGKGSFGEYVAEYNERCVVFLLVTEWTSLYSPLRCTALFFNCDREGIPCA